MMKPSLARMVIASVPEPMNNGADEAPAVITRVWNEHPDGGWVVNLRILCDSENVIWQTSVRLHDEKPENAAPGDAWWPPRV